MHFTSCVKVNQELYAAQNGVVREIKCLFPDMLLTNTLTHTDDACKDAVLDDRVCVRVCV